MPVYDYQCKECEHHFTEQYKIADRKIPTENPCPECGKKEVQQLIGCTNHIQPDADKKLRTETTGEFREKMNSLKRFYRHRYKGRDYS